MYKVFFILIANGGGMQTTLDLPETLLDANAPVSVTFFTPTILTASHIVL
jgi:hypothetical protein